ncbi:MAG: hypothetical protein M3232_06685 [Thermoproteota archaeon]|nr:hypothetical protein [Thermoproteota archaeon]
MATASITTQQSSMVSEQRSSDNDSTVIQQSSGQSQSSSSTSSSVITSESSSGESVSSSNRIVSRVGNDNLQIDRQSTGKIASSRLNLTNGEVEGVLFGNWSLNGTSGFVANFIYKPSNGTAPIEYNMSGLELRSINQINDNLVLAGTIDVASNSTAVLQDVPVTTMIQNGILAIGFGNSTQASDLFGGIPILGFEQ